MNVISQEDLESEYLPRNVKNSGIQSGNMLVNISLYMIYFIIFVMAIIMMLLLAKVPSIKTKIDKKLASL